MRALRQLALLLITTLLSACACTPPPPPQDLIVVLPASDGHIGGVVVEAAGRQLVLDKAYAAAKPGSGVADAVEMDAKEVGEMFVDALAARPIPPKSYTLYFESGGNELVPASRAALENMFAEMSQRKAAEIVITGHTDTVGPSEDNDRLSLDRAKAVGDQLRDRLSAAGVNADAVTTVGRGERELLVDTADRVAEGRNRRVEITVR